MNELKKTPFKSPIFRPDWNRLVTSLQKDFKLLIVCLLLLGAFRVFEIVYFRGHMDPQVHIGDYLAAIANGARFDGVIAGYTCIFCVLISLVCGFFPLQRFGDRLRSILAFVFIWLSGVLFVANLIFISEFKDNFNLLIFNIIYDDTVAIVQSAWADYPVVTYFLAAVAAAVCLSMLVRRFIRKPFSDNPAARLHLSRSWHKGGAVVVLIALFVIVIRGSAGGRPVQFKDAGVTSDPFLNKLVLNPYFAINQAFSIRGKLSNSKGLETYLPDRGVAAAAGLLFNKPLKQPDLDAYFKKSAHGVAKAPRHIFVLVIESLDSWSLLDEYSELDLLPDLKQLGREGLLIRPFLSASSGTMTSLAAILTGLPDVGVFTNYRPEARRPFPTSIAPQFKQLGYETHFYYGGYLSWQRLYDFCKAQGFDAVHGGGDMGAWNLKEWGLDDHVMYDYISCRLSDDKPTFNIILTTTNHSPYDVPVYDWGFPYREMPDALKNRYDGQVPVSVFGHLWYSDKVLARFIRKTEKQLPGTLFAVTGDHRSRKYLSRRYTRYERRSVPLLLYGKPYVPTGMDGDRIAGSHMDIMPTLIELCAPEGFAYYSLGTNLLDPHRRQIGFGVLAAITPDHILELGREPENLPFSAGKHTMADADTVRHLIRAHYGVGWWRLMRGAGLP